ncbi:hypothetical protein [Ferdinandcohnia sp. Marseille-Q9671]
MGVGTLAYLLLIIIGLVALCLALWISKSLRLFILYFTAVGITLLFDYIVYVWGKAYKYHTGILDNKFDTHVGALINGHLLPSFAVLFIALRLKWYWGIPLAVFFTLIEILFTKWGLFEHFWWSPLYTVIGIFIYFPIARLWWNSLQKKWIRFGTNLLSFYGIYTTLSFSLYGILQLRSFQVEWVEKFHRDSTAFNTITGLVFGAALAWINLNKPRNAWYLFVIVSFIVYDYLLKYIGVVKTYNLLMDSSLSLLFFLVGLLFVRYAQSKLKKFR